MQKILLVEDDESIRDLYKRQLALAGFSVETASTGQEGLALAQKNKYDLLILDIMLPDVNGVEILKRIRKEQGVNKDTVTIFLTNLGQEDVVREGLMQGAIAYLIKAQYTPDQIVAEVKNFLSQASLKPSQP